MEIMNYEEMVNNAKIINTLAQKTIQCSRDYVESKKDDILEQMMGYIYLTLKDVMSSDLVYDKEFSSYLSKYLCGKLYITTGRFGGDGEGAVLQAFYHRNEGTLRVYMNDEGFWFSQCSIDESAFGYLVTSWEEFKRDLDRGLKEAIEKNNKRNQYKVKRQLELHEAVKNFQI